MHLDNWGLKAKKLGFRSRAVFKLEEILEKTNALKGCKNVLDIGAAPGGWSQLIKYKLKKANVFAIDIIDIEPIKGVNFFQQKVEDIDLVNDIFLLKGKNDVVISNFTTKLSVIRMIN